MNDLFSVIVWWCAASMVISMTVIVAALACAIIYAIWSMITE